jgi:hypothetical protein
VLAKALIMAGSDPYKRTFWIEVDWRSFAMDGGWWMVVVEGCPQLGHSLYRWMIASLHKKQQNLKQMIKHQFLNDKTKQKHFLFS